MAFFDSFTESLKQKWLQFFQVNRDWITLHTTVESVYTPDGGKRPSSYLILGVVNALEPKLAQLMYPFAKLNPDADTLIEVLDLNFDPDIALGNRVGLTTEPEGYGNVSVEEEAAPASEVEESGFGEDLSADSGDTDGFGDMPLDGDNSMEVSETEVSSEADMGFGEMSFDGEALEEEGELNPPDESAFSDVLSDVWGDETSLQKDEENNDMLGEELPSGVFDESEIARLFPNS